MTEQSKVSDAEQVKAKNSKRKDPRHIITHTTIITSRFSTVRFGHGGYAASIVL